MKNDQADKDRTVSRYEFYRDGFRQALMIGILLSLTAAADAWRNVYNIYHPAQREVIAVNDRGQLAEVIPLTETRMTPAAMQQWAVDETLRVCNIDWVHYRKQLDDAMAEGAFTEAAWNGLMAQMRNQHTLEALAADRIIETCTVKEAALIKRSGLIDGVPSYEIEVPVVISFRGQSELLDRTLPTLLSIHVRHADMNRYPRGVVIFGVQFESGKEPLDGGT